MDQRTQMLEMLDRPELPPPSQPQLQRLGLGWQATFPEGIQIRIMRLRESRGELSGELVVTSTGGWPTTIGGHLFRGRLNLDSISSRNTLAKNLKDRANADWSYYLELFCVSVLDQERRGEPVVTVGLEPELRAHRYCLHPILSAGLPTIIFGPGGTGKSTLAAGIAVSVKTGAEVVPGWKPESAPVLVLDYEDGRDSWNEHAIRLARGAGIDPPGLLYRPGRRPIAEEVEELATIVSEHGIGLLIVDSVGLACGAGRDGSDASEASLRMFAALREIGVTSLLIDHVAGDELRSSSPIAKPYGSIYKVNLARSVFELRREKDGVPDRSQALLVHTKFNRGARLAPIGLTFTYRLDGAIRLERGEVEAPDLEASLPLTKRLARLLRDGEKSVSFLADSLAITPAAVRTIVSRHKDFARTASGAIGLRHADE